MESLLMLVEGPFGAIVMVLAGLLSVLTMSIIAPIMIVIDDYTVMGHRAYNYVFAVITIFMPIFVLVYALFNWKQVRVPIFLGFGSLTLAIGVFIFRAMISTFFGTEMV